MSGRQVILEQWRLWSLQKALAEQGRGPLMERLREIAPDLSRQYTSLEGAAGAYAEMKRRGQHAFQCGLMLKALERFPRGRLQVVDIGDSAGTHMLYLKELAKEKFKVETLSVNLDPEAVEKIRARGLPAMLCRAETLSLDRPVDLFTCFETLEHLHDPSMFLRRLAKAPGDGRLLVTVPYQRQSRVGLRYIRREITRPVRAEEEHIFELSPGDWTLLFRHAGWRVVMEETYHQYPRRWPLLRGLWAWYWRRADFEGFWGALLEKDMSLSDLYQDWGE